MVFSAVTFIGMCMIGYIVFVVNCALIKLYDAVLDRHDWQGFNIVCENACTAGQLFEPHCGLQLTHSTVVEEQAKMFHVALLHEIAEAAAGGGPESSSMIRDTTEISPQE